MKTLLIDNYDSYTFNLYQFIAEINKTDPLVVRNDQVTWLDLAGLDYDNIVISPGPGTPERDADFGVCRDALLWAEVPVLGVCLGHQGIGAVFGGAVVRAPEPMHGRLSRIYHDGSDLFAGIAQGFAAVRYHSLVVKQPVPPSLQEIAWTADGLLMGLRHRTRPLWGVQFHPESIATESGRVLLANFARLTRAHGRRREHAGRPAPACGVAHSVVPSRPRPRSSGSAGALEVVARRLPQVQDAAGIFATRFALDPFAFWLDSSRVHPGLSRFSFLGDAGGPHAEILRYHAASRRLEVQTSTETKTLHQSVFDYIDERTARWATASPDLPFDFVGGFVGYFGYELKAECGGRAAHASPLPDAMFVYADRFVAVDHEAGASYLVAVVPEGQRASALEWFDRTEAALDAAAAPAVPPAPRPGRPPAEFRLSRGYGRYLKDIQACKQHLFDGESYEICLTTHLRTREVVEPWTLYQTLRQVNPAPYSAYLRFGDVAILSSSPERFLKIDRARGLEAKPIKGTRRRGRTADEDRRLAEDLRTNEKDRAENLMIVDLLRNDLGLVSEIGSVHVPTLMGVETYATVHHLVSTIRGTLRGDLGAVDAIRAAFPAGSMTGAPKVRTMEIIDELEGEARGVYSGALGYVSLNGAVDLSVVIRTIVATPRGSSIGIGGAIVVQSDLEDEFDEILLKAQALVRAIVLATRGPEGKYRILNGRDRPASAVSVPETAAPGRRGRRTRGHGGSHA